MYNNFSSLAKPRGSTVADIGLNFGRGMGGNYKKFQNFLQNWLNTVKKRKTSEIGGG